MNVKVEQPPIKLGYRCQVRVIKATDRPKTPDDYQREHEIALLKLLAPKHPNVVKELAASVVKS